jgi:hypothetical protein
VKRHHGDFTITANRLGASWHWTVEIGNSGAIWTQGTARTERAAWRAAETAADRGHLEFALRGGRPRTRPGGQARVAQPRRPGGPSRYTLPAMQRSEHHPFDASEYVTRRGHHLRRGDEVVVMTPNNVTGYGVVTALLPRYLGDVPDVRVRNPLTGRTLIVNAINVEPESGRIRGQARTKGTIAQRWAQVHAAEAAGHPIRHPRTHVFGK